MGCYATESEASEVYLKARERAMTVTRSQYEGGLSELHDFVRGGPPPQRIEKNAHLPKGVCIKKNKTKPFVSNIQVLGRSIYLGSYADKEQAGKRFVAAKERRDTLTEEEKNKPWEDVKSFIRGESIIEPA